jgi:ubiquinone/menaquinone biosynthesis C-methylase UbiE
MQTAYELGRIEWGPDVDSDIDQAIYRYLVDDLGQPEASARRRADAEAARARPKAVLSNDLGRRGITVEGMHVLDLGAGLGALSEELVLRGASVFAIEPGQAWASLAERRAGRHNGPYDLRRVRGEQLPFENGSMDVVISLQVLEHVQDPQAVLAEVYRVLKPGGHFFVACENYLAFREGHYQVAWLPLLPKWLGSLYLSTRGRPAQFLQEAVTYVTFPQVMRWTRALGFERVADAELLDRIDNVPGFGGHLLRMVAHVTGGRAPGIADRARRTFKFGIKELFVKPN